MASMMKAVLWTAYGDPTVLKIGQLPKPVPNRNQILVKVKAAGLTVGDTELRKAEMPLPSIFNLMLRLIVGITKPTRFRVLGQEFSGVVAEVGEGCEGVALGDAVFGSTGWPFGADAEYVLKEWPSRGAGGTGGRIAFKPSNLTFQEAAASPTGGLEAVHLVKAAKVKPGDHVLVVGAAGSIGTFAVQLLKHLGAVVTGVDVEEKFDTMRAVGVDHFVDYTKEDYLKSGRQYDVVIDVPSTGPFSHHLLKSGGRYLLGNLNLRTMLQGLLFTPSDKRVAFEAGKGSLEDWDDLVVMLKEGILKPVMDKAYGWEAASEAHAYVESGKKRGNVVLVVDADESN
ncbi:alcohol dehydrogenase zinc-binding domain protein [Fimicolochytrium jonesii]|uniref:alcohol dehydrogenase zinc-binding domain protein n=1 Tax=Fimicolochytrium jonesii TaxID=1396493 RepID=UPI0022FE5EC4|nr:alcohol dehydrogenase zinc-binding domain protein [Fimicolochytrium jonesii]KAI8819762.1 alcohol dehydrogenase zinc-binding domain protein [Fimicolochytrium jonesii]